MNIIELLLSLPTRQITGFQLSTWLIERTLDIGTGKVWGKVREKINKDEKSIDCKIYNLIEKSVLECFATPINIDKIAPICEIIFYTINKTAKIDLEDIKREIQQKRLELENFHIDIWYIKILLNISKEEELANYFMIKALNELLISHQRDSEESMDLFKSIDKITNNKHSYINEDHKRLAEMVKKYSKDGFRWRMEEIDNFYEIFMSNYSQGNMTVEIVELGYWLTDVYERNRKFDRSIEIALIILDYLKKIEKDVDISIDKDYIQKIIGCAYSLIIPKRILIEKRELLEQAETYLIYAEKCCKMYCDNGRNRMVERKFLEGLLCSNYGAWFVNMADLEKSEGNIEYATELYMKGIDKHITSKDSREIELEILQSEENNCGERVKEVKDRIARCKSNIGGVYFKMENYEKAITFQKAALKDFENLGDEERKNLVKNYIVGGYIKMWETDPDKYKEQDYLECKKYVSEMKAYDKNEINYSKREDELREIKEKVVCNPIKICTSI